MKKRFLPLLALLALCVAMVCPFGAQAATSQPASLTLYYQQEGRCFPDLSIAIYRVAEMFPNGEFGLIAPYADYPVDIQNITEQSQWVSVAQTLWGYMVENQVAPDREGLTDEQGAVCFEDLAPGLYFVREVRAEQEQGTYLFNQCLVFVPTPFLDGTYDYDVEAIPKCSNFIPKTRYSVTKLWQDAGYQNLRPEKVTVKIYQNGEFWQSQVLSPENDWTYAWEVSGEDLGGWTVVEQDVPDRYKVKLQESDGAFSLINTYTIPTDNPGTGDSFAPLTWILAMCGSGIALLLLGLFGRRRK